MTTNPLTPEPPDGMGPWEQVRQLEFLRAYKDDLPTLRIESTIADRHYTTFWISHYKNGGRA